MNNDTKQFNEKLNKLIEQLQNKINDHFAQHLKMLTPPKLEAHAGKSYVKVAKHDRDSKGASVYFFIAAKDISNKTMGNVKFGDILKPATWKAPTKHARGNLFDESTWNCIGIYGVDYLRG